MVVKISGLLWHYKQKIIRRQKANRSVALNWTENILRFPKKYVSFIYYTLIIKVLFLIHRKTAEIIIPNMALNVYYFLEQKA